jgi:hypothetical protein
MADRKGIFEALERLDTRALGEEMLSGILETVSAARRDRKADSWKDPNIARRSVALAQALYASRRIARQEYVFFASSPVEGVHEGRWMDRQYDDDLCKIQKEMALFRKKYHLGPDEYWPVGLAPKAYQRLSSQFNSALEKSLIKTLREFGLNDLADLKENNPDEFDRLRERGRRSVFHKDEFAPVLKDIVSQYEVDAGRAASAGAYSAAITLLGAGLEGLLLLRCLRSNRKAQVVAGSLPKRLRPRSREDLTTWTFETLIETCSSAGWLPPVVTPIAQYNAAGLAHFIRKMRNFVHPARRARERPWSEADEDDYRDAEAIYLILMSKMVGRSSRTNRCVQPILSVSPST